MELLWIYLVLVCQSLSCYCLLENCDVEGCTACNSSMAICESSTSDIPQALPRSLRSLNIHFKKNPTLYNADLLANLPMIEDLIISGNVHSVAPNSFQRLSKLKCLTIIDTDITSLPARLFSSNNSLKALNVERNKLLDIPVGLFDQLGELESLNVGNNCIRLPSCKTIGPEFSKLPQLLDLNLAGIIGNSTCVLVASSTTFFSSVNHMLTKLNLTDVSRLWNVNASLLSHFQYLEELDLTGIAPYRNCPNHARELFPYLPSSLKILHARRWRSISSPDPFCYLTGVTLTILKSLPQLEEIDFKYSDMIFGPTLEKTLFSNFTHLQHLDMGYCRISNIVYDAFDYCPNLTTVLFNGNPLGSRKIRLQTVTRSILSLNLRRTGIATDAYQFFIPIRFAISDNLKSIDFSDNFLHKMPLFSYRDNGNLLFQKYSRCQIEPIDNHNISVRSSFAPSLQSVNLNNNYLTTYLDTAALINSNITELCSNMSNISVIRMEGNRLEDITGLCPSLTELHLRNNRIGLNWDDNMAALSKLNKLRFLDLSENAIGTLPFSLVLNMDDLETLIIEHNNISFIDNNLFSKNLKLRTIKIALNKLLSFNINIAPLPHLSVIDLHNNQITNFNQAFLTSLGTSSVQLFNIQGNTFTCDCDSFFKTWLSEEHIYIPKYRQLRCSGEMEFAHNYTRNTFKCDAELPVVIVCSILGSILLTVLIAIPCYKYRWYMSHPKVVLAAFVSQLKKIRFDRECVYDGFISYDGQSDGDIEFVKNELLPTVEEEGTCDMYVHDRDSTLGANHHTELCNAVEKSRKVIIILSNSYINSKQCRGEADLAGRDTYGSKFYQPNRILVIVKDRLEEDKIEAPITTLLTENVVNIYNVKDEKTKKKVWERVKNFMVRPRHVFRKKPTSATNEAASHSDSRLEMS